VPQVSRDMGVVRVLGKGSKERLSRSARRRWHGSSVICATHGPNC